MKVHYVPVLIANFKPFRLIIRDEQDEWKPSIEEINSCTYNYVKLHRVTKFFNAHLSNNFPACFGFDGSLIFPFTADFRNDDKIVEETNRILASILIGGVYVESISPLDISRGKMNSYGYYQHSQTFSLTSDFHSAIGECGAGNLNSIKLMNPPLIEASKIISAYEYGHKILQNVPLLLPSLFINSFTYYKNFQLREALAMCWISIEQLIEEIWNSTLINEAKLVNIPNRRKFLDSQQWNVAHKIEMLYQKNYIMDNDYKLLSKARIARNDFIHKGLTPTYEAVHSAIVSLITLLEKNSSLNGINFGRAKLEKYIPSEIAESIPPTYIQKENKEIPAENILFWRARKVLPGDKDWVGEIETFEDITLEPLQN